MPNLISPRNLTATLLLVASSTLTLSESANAATESIVLSGEIAPDAGGGTYGILGQPDISNNGEVVFYSTINGGTTTEGVFVSDGDITRSIALAGETAPGGAGTFASFFITSEINNFGDVALRATLTGSASPIGIFLEGISGLEPVALIGGLAPGTAGTYIEFGPPDLNDRGEVAFTGAFLAFPPTAGIFVESDTIAGRLVVEVGDSVPGIGGSSFTGFGSPAINDDGQVAFKGFTDGPGGESSGVWIYSEAGLGTLIAEEGQVAPGTGGATFEAFNTRKPSVDNTGNVYFDANLSAAAGYDAHFVGDGPNLAVISVPGDPVPGVGDPIISSIQGEPEASQTGGVAFIAQLDSLEDSEGIYLDPADGSARVEVARQGDAAPGTDGGVLQGFSIRVAPDTSGRVAFASSVSDSPTTGMGIFVPEPSTVPSLTVGASLICWLSRRRQTEFLVRSPR